MLGLGLPDLATISLFSLLHFKKNNSSPKEVPQSSSNISTTKEWVPWRVIFHIMQLVFHMAKSCHWAERSQTPKIGNIISQRIQGKPSGLVKALLPEGNRVRPEYMLQLASRAKPRADNGSRSQRQEMPIGLRAWNGIKRCYHSIAISKNVLGWHTVGQDLFILAWMHQ